MDEDRPFLRVAHVLQDRQEMVEIMAVDRPDVIEAELLEQRAAGQEAARKFFDAPGFVVEAARQTLGELLAGFAQRSIGAARDEPGEIGRHRPDRRGDRHVVVVEDHDEARMQRAGIVHRLIGHAGRHGAVADHRDDLVGAAGEIAGHRHAESGRDRGRGMGRAERVVFAFRPFGEARQAAALPQGADAVAPAGEDLVRIGLMADVPDQPVARRIEDIMQRHRQLDHAEPRPEMAAGDRNRSDRLGAQFVGDLLQSRWRQRPQILWGSDPLEERKVGSLCHLSVPLLRGRIREVVPEKDYRFRIPHGKGSRG